MTAKDIMITNPKVVNGDLAVQEIFCVCCNDKIAEKYLHGCFEDIHDTQIVKAGKISGFDFICWSCVQKLRKGMRLF